MEPMEIWAKIFDLVKCNHCGKWKSKESFGYSLYYACICLKCQNLFNLCPDCGGPVILSKEEENFSCACSGWHRFEEEDEWEI